MTTTHDLPVRVYYEDTDAGGVVYYANYLKFAERGRTEFLDFFGFQNSALLAADGVLFVVKRVEAEYLSPARLDDRLTVKTSLISLKNTSFEMRQEVVRGENILCTMKVLLVCVDQEGGKPVRLPSVLKDKLKETLL
jgi:acyl-CoA thioester hydrolase